MGRRRRRVIRIVKKRLPTVFTCPRCGEEAVRVTIDKQTGHATVLCALCQLKDEFPAHPQAQAIDVYSYFTDKFYGVKDPRAIIPREREGLSAPETEEPQEARIEETTAIEAVPETPITEMANPVPAISSSETEPAETSQAPTELPDQTSPALEQAPAGENEQGEKAEQEEEGEPFADILQDNKDKKRYSPNPLPQQSSEEA